MASDKTYLSLLTDIKANQLSVIQLIHQRDGLQKRLCNINCGSPRTSSKSYQLASKALRVNGELAFTDQEIDSSLPAELRKTK
jgi:hypothetical protein